MLKLETFTMPHDLIGVGVEMPLVQREILDKVLNRTSRGKGSFYVTDLKSLIEIHSQDFYGTRIYIAATHIAWFIEKYYPNLVKHNGKVKGLLYKSLEKDKREWPNFEGLKYVGNFQAGIPHYEPIGEPTKFYKENTLRRELEEKYPQLKTLTIHESELEKLKKWLESDREKSFMIEANLYGRHQTWKEIDKNLEITSHEDRDDPGDYPTWSRHYEPPTDWDLAH